MTTANVVKQIPFSPDLAFSGLTSQESATGLFLQNNVPTSIGGYVSNSQSPVTVTRNSQALTQNVVNGDLQLVAVDSAAFEDVGIQIGRQKDNSLSNSDFQGGTTGYTLVDAGGIVTNFEVVASGVAESDQALRIRMVNGTASAQFVDVYQAISGVLSGEHWAAQAYFQVQEKTGTAAGLIRIWDFANATITSTPMPESTDVYTREAVTQQATANSSDFRWNVNFQVPIGDTLEVFITNVNLTLSTWGTHYVPSTTGPTTRESDVVDVGSTGNQFFSQTVDEVWSIDFRTLGPLTVIAGGESPLQYLFSTYSGVNGTSLFVDATNTITWRADFNSSFEDVTIALGTALGQLPFRAYMRVIDDGVGGFDRELFLEQLDTGDITASAVFNTINLPIQGDVMKIGRDNADGNILDGFVGRLTFWGNRSNLSMNRINDNWPTP